MAGHKSVFSTGKQGGRAPKIASKQGKPSTSSEPIIISDDDCEDIDTAHIRTSKPAANKRPKPSPGLFVSDDETDEDARPTRKKKKTSTQASSKDVKATVLETSSSQATTAHPGSTPHKARGSNSVTHNKSKASRKPGSLARKANAKHGRSRPASPSPPPYDRSTSALSPTARRRGQDASGREVPRSAMPAYADDSDPRAAAAPSASSAFGASFADAFLNHMSKRSRPLTTTPNAQTDRSSLHRYPSSSSPNLRSSRLTYTRRNTPESIGEDHDHSAGVASESIEDDHELAGRTSDVISDTLDDPCSPMASSNKRRASSSLVSDIDDTEERAANTGCLTEVSAGKIQKRRRPAKNKFFAVAHKHGLALAKGNEDAFEQADMYHDLLLNLIDGLDRLNADNDELDKALDRRLEDLREAARLNYRAVIGDIPREMKAKDALQAAEKAMVIHRGNVARYARFTEARMALETIEDRVHQGFMWYQDEVRGLREVFEEFGLDWGTVAADGSMGLLKD